MILNLLHRIKAFLFHIDGRNQLEIAVENGLKLGMNCHIMGECIIDPGHCWLIEIGDNVTLAPRVHILAHDASTKMPLGYTVIRRVKIGNNVFIGANSVILPGVEIGDNVVIGSGSIVTHDISTNSLAVGNPANVISTYEEYIDKRKMQMNKHRKFDASYIIGNISEERKNEMKSILDRDGIGFII